MRNKYAPKKGGKRGGMGLVLEITGLKINPTKIKYTQNVCVFVCGINYFSERYVCNVSLRKRTDLRYEAYGFYLAEYLGICLVNLAGMRQTRKKSH